VIYLSVSASKLIPTLLKNHTYIRKRSDCRLKVGLPISNTSRRDSNVIQAAGKFF